MGSRLVGRAIRHALPNLPHGPAGRVLLVLAHHARDTDARPMFHKGDDYLARTLGYPDDQLESGCRAVRRARTVLRDAGYVEPADTKQPHRFKRRWVLTLPEDAEPE